MAITYEAISAINQALPRVDLKGKHYSMVAARVQGFRKLCPMGRIETEIVSVTDDMVIMRATISDENGTPLASGTALEERGANLVNRTSFLENCETSAVGRALAMLGIGSEEQMCSAEELVNAIKNQSGSDDPKVRAEIMRIINQFPERELNRKVCERYKVGALSELSSEDAKRCLRDLKRTVKDFEAA